MEQKFTEEKRLAILEVFPDAGVIYYDISYDKTLISGEPSVIYPVPICDGNPYNFTTSILLTKPIQTPDAQKRWGIPDPKAQECWMTHEEIFEAIDNGAKLRDNENVHNDWQSYWLFENTEICLKPDYSKKMEDWDWQDMKVDV